VVRATKSWQGKEYQNENQGPKAYGGSSLVRLFRAGALSVGHFHLNSPASIKQHAG
jgi:hypothetical protein